VAARLTQTVHTCEKSPENGGTLKQAFCYERIRAKGLGAIEQFGWFAAIG